LKALSIDDAFKRIINYTANLLKDQPEDGPAVWPKHVAEL
jgi:hypothetical protein